MIFGPGKKGTAYLNNKLIDEIRYNIDSFHFANNLNQEKIMFGPRIEIIKEGKVTLHMNYSLTNSIVQVEQEYFELINDPFKEIITRIMKGELPLPNPKN